MLALLAVPALGADENAGTARTETKVHYTPADRASGRYQYVPIDVPAGTGFLTISYAYDRADGAVDRDASRG